MRLPPIKAEPPDVPDEDNPPTVRDSDDTNEAHEDDIPLSELAKKLRGTFTTKGHVLERKLKHTNTDAECARNSCPVAEL